MASACTYEIRCCDNRDDMRGLPTLPDGSVDHVITDPPYDEHTHKAQRRADISDNKESFPCSSTRNAELGFDAIGREEQIEAARQFARIARRWVLVFCSLEQTGEWRSALELAGLDHVRIGIWRKLASTPQFTGDRPAQACEAIMIAHPPGRKRWNGGGKHGIWSAKIVNNSSPSIDGGRVHTTQKPIALMEQLITDFTDPGDIICDPYAGSGTTGVAARRTGRSFIGFERDQKYVGIAERRISDTREQMTLGLGIP